MSGGINWGNCKLHDNFHCGGFAKTIDHQLRLARDFTRTTGILLDPIYTSKVYLAIVDLAKSGYLRTDSKVLFIHTGGQLGIFGMKKKFLSL